MPANMDTFIDQLSNMSVKELSDLVSKIEETFGVSAAAAVAAGPVVGDASVAVEKSEYTVVLTDGGSQKNTYKWECE